MQQCTEFEGGRLLHPYSNVGDILKPDLFPNAAGAVYISLGLQQFPQSAADEPDQEWYYVMPDGTKTKADAADLLWRTDVGEPVAASKVSNCPFGYCQR
uniref:Uncharacterized protein n=1 Tax=Plectus sambesii TaxID=2011161 RepID=A0A914XB57_9BILA